MAILDTVRELGVQVAQEQETITALRLMANRQELKIVALECQLEERSGDREEIKVLRSLLRCQREEAEQWKKEAEREREQRQHAEAALEHERQARNRVESQLVAHEERTEELLDEERAARRTAEQESQQAFQKLGRQRKRIRRQQRRLREMEVALDLKNKEIESYKYAEESRLGLR